MSGPAIAARGVGLDPGARHRLGALFAFLGPGYLVSVGYMDPGNWATSLAGGSKFGYALLSIALLSNLMAILLQAAVRPARLRYRLRSGAGVPQLVFEARRFSLGLAEVAICATDLAEVIGPPSASIFCSAFRSSSACS